MATHRAVLIAAVLAGLAAAAGVALASPPAPCAGCHPPHYVSGGSCTSCHRGNASATRKNLGHEHLLSRGAASWAMRKAPPVELGAKLRDVLGCRRCHVTGGRGNALATDLDRVAWKRDQDELRRAMLQPSNFMPDFGLTLERADGLIAVLLRDADPQPAEDRYAVRFKARGATGPDAFETKCGPCHQALTARGPLGTGRTGPNLSGLFTAHYPSPDGRAWTRERLARWLRNPRSERPLAMMRPVEVTEQELDSIAAALGCGPAR